MHRAWVHVGRVWSDGGPYLVLDAALRSAWRGFSGEDFDRLLGLGPHDDCVGVGAGTALLVGDPVVRDDSWIEVFTCEDGAVAAIQADGDDYPRALRQALRFPADDDDEPAPPLSVTSGRLAFLNAATDGIGEHASPARTAAPGPLPAEHGGPPGGLGSGLVLETPVHRLRPAVRSFTELDDGTCFSRWLLLPEPALPEPALPEPPPA